MNNCWENRRPVLLLVVFIKKDIFVNRRLQEKRWGFEPKWFIEHVWKSYLTYGQTVLAQPKNGVLLLSGNDDFDEELIAGFLGF